MTTEGQWQAPSPPGDGREYGVRLKDKVSAEFFRRLFAGRGFTVDSGSTGSSFTARRK